MEIIPRSELLIAALGKVKARAMNGYFNGLDWSPYFEQCMWFFEQYQIQIIFTRDIGHHTGGWWKNPDYERCWHLSISYVGGINKNIATRIIDGLFGSAKKMIWIEPPYSDEGKSAEVWHYRLFCDLNWKPIIPKGEVYSTQFTEKGWKSFSEIHRG